ncbi:MAG: hypothetical protein AAF467_15145 [Actinomycetota bacterium]
MTTPTNARRRGLHLLPRDRTPDLTDRTSPAQLATAAATEATERACPILELTTGGFRYSEAFAGLTHDAVSGTVLLAHDRDRSRQRFSFDDLPVASGRYGVVLCDGVLEHVWLPLGVLIELNRVSAPFARLYLAAPLTLPQRGLTTRGHRQSAGLNYLLEAAGFSIEQVNPMRGDCRYGVIARKVRPRAAPIPGTDDT